MWTVLHYCQSYIFIEINAINVQLQSPPDINVTCLVPELRSPRITLNTYTYNCLGSIIYIYYISIKWYLRRIWFYFKYFFLHHALTSLSPLDSTFTWPKLGQVTEWIIIHHYILYYVSHICVIWIEKEVVS